MSLNIRPHKVVQAANWLINNSSLYRQEGITLNEGWGVQYTANCLLDDTNTENQSEQEIEKSSGSNKQDGNDSNDNDDQWTEDEEKHLLVLLTPC